MALGGYKFAGYKVTKPEGATDAEWALLAHKCRVKAFVESNNASGAGWEFDQTSGQISFETYGNVIHRLDDIGYNYVSFFKHGTDNAYFAIMTMGYYGQSADLASGRVYLLPVNQGTSASYYGIGNTMFCRISRTQLTPSNVLVDIANEIRAVPCGYLLTGSNFSNGANPTAWNTTATYLDSGLQGFWAGFAMKGTNISSFLSYYPASNSINTCHFSIGGYSSLGNNNDNNNVFVCSAGKASSTNKNERLFSQQTTYMISDFAFITVGDSGQVSVSRVIPDLKATYSGDMYYYPFAPLNIYQLNSVYHNYYKGAVAIDFLAWNSPRSTSQLPMLKSIKANGNYLCLTYPTDTNGCSVVTFDGGTVYTHPVLYCGWDPSNPDITSEDAWTAYNG